MQTDHKLRRICIEYNILLNFQIVTPLDEKVSTVCPLGPSKLISGVLENVRCTLASYIE